MINMHTKFKVSKINCNKDKKGNAKWKNSRFELPFGVLRGNAQHDQRLAASGTITGLAEACIRHSTEQEAWTGYRRHGQLQTGVQPDLHVEGHRKSRRLAASRVLIC